jgi:hypothetical protein
MHITKIQELKNNSLIILTQMSPSLELWHNYSRNSKAWQARNQKPWSSIGDQGGCYLTSHLDEQPLVQDPHVDRPIWKDTNKKSTVTKTFLNWHELQCVHKSQIWYPLAVPNITFMRISHVKGLTGPTSPCNHCSRLPLSTYSYTSILQKQ